MPPDPVNPKNLTPDERKLAKQQEKAYKQMEKFLKDARKESSGGKGGKQARGFMTRQEVEEQTPYADSLVSIAGKSIFGDKSKGKSNILKRTIKSKLKSMPGIGGLLEFRDARKEQIKIKKNAEKKRAKLEETIKKVVSKSSALQGAYITLADEFQKQYEGDDWKEGLIDTFIALGLTDEDSLEQQLLAMAGGGDARAIIRAGNELAEEGEITASPFIGSAFTGGLTPTGGGAGGGGGGAAPDPAIRQELAIHTSLLSQILSTLENPPRDKLQEREDKLEASRGASALQAQRSRNKRDKASGDAEGGDGGEDGGGLLSTAMDLLMLKMGLGGGGRPRPPRPNLRTRIRNVGGRVGRVVSGGMNLLAKGASKIGLGGVASGGANLLSKAGSWLGNLWSGAKNFAGKLNPAKFVSDTIKSSGGKILKTVLKIPIIAPAIEALFLGSAISDIKSQNIPPQEKKKLIGSEIGKSLGGIVGAIGGGALGSAIPIPFLGTALGAIAGDYAGRFLGEKLAEAIGPESIYNIAASIPGLGGLISVDPPAEMQGMEGMEGTSSTDGTLASPSGGGANLTPNTSSPNLGQTTSAAISSSTRNAAASNVAGGGGGTAIVAPSTNVNTVNNNTTVSNVSVAQSEASFMASSMMNGGLPRFA